MASLMSSSVSVPRSRTPARAPCSFSDSVSNIAGQATRRLAPGRSAAVRGFRGGPAGDIGGEMSEGTQRLIAVAAVVVAVVAAGLDNLAFKEVDESPAVLRFVISAVVCVA